MKENLDQILSWKLNLHTPNLKEFTSHLSCHTIVYSDASNTGYGGYMVENPSDIVHGMWSNNESMKRSTWKKLTAVNTFCFLCLNNNIFIDVEWIPKSKNDQANCNYWYC